jgi:hypothetical protein
MSRGGLQKAPLPLALLLLSGCATMLPRGPDIYTLRPLPDAKRIVVAYPLDQRSDPKKLGSIGIYQLSMPDKPTELIAKELVVALHARGFNGAISQTSAAASPSTLAEEARRQSANGILAITIQRISFKSFDALMDPPTARVILQVTLYNSNGKTLATDTVIGEVQRLINTFALQKSSGQLVAEAIHNAAHRLVNQSALNGALDTLSSLQ